MSEFSPAEAALEGLRIPRERPVAVLWWWAAHAANALLQVLVLSLPTFKRLDDLVPSIQAASDAVRAGPTDPVAAQRFLGLLAEAAPPFTAFAAVSLLMQMILSTAVLRAVLRPTDRAYGYLRLSMDEVRQLGLALLVCAAFLGYAFFVSVASSLVLGLFAAFMPAAGLGLLAFLVVVIAFLYPTVRLSLAPALTLADGKISFLRAWSLTQGRFWPLLGAYVIALAIAAVLWFAVTLPVQLALKLTGSLGDVATGSGLGQLIKPGFLVAWVVGSLLSALIGAIMTAPIASAFRQITAAADIPAPVRTSPTSPWG